MQRAAERLDSVGEPLEARAAAAVRTPDAVVGDAQREPAVDRFDAELYA